jgi:hypothetical protein
LRQSRKNFAANQQTLTYFRTPQHDQSELRQTVHATPAAQNAQLGQNPLADRRSTPILDAAKLSFRWRKQSYAMAKTPRIYRKVDLREKLSRRWQKMRKSLGSPISN